MSFAREEKFLNEKVQIEFLTQCKFELSAEVIRWKEENLKLRKENETAGKKVEELQTLVNKLSRHIHELETSLFLSYEENKRLRLHTVTVGEENTILHNRLSKSKLQSLPWLESRAKSATQTAQALEGDTSSPFSIESCDDVSAKLVTQMQREIKEMQLFQNRLMDSNNKEIVRSLEPYLPTSSRDVDQCSKTEMDQFSQKLNILASDAESLKHRLSLQNQKLHFLLNQDTENKNVTKKVNHRILVPSKSYEISHKSQMGSNRATKTTDDAFREYFIQQLNKAVQNGNENEEATLSAAQTEARSYPNKVNMPLRKEHEKLSNIETKTDGKKESSSGIKVCPICKVVFTTLLRDSEFEDHVMTHLKAFSESLLTQYEIV